MVEFSQYYVYTIIVCVYTANHEPVYEGGACVQGLIECTLNVPYSYIEPRFMISS